MASINDYTTKYVGINEDDSLSIYPVMCKKTDKFAVVVFATDGDLLAEILSFKGFETQEEAAQFSVEAVIKKRGSVGAGTYKLFAQRGKATEKLCFILVIKTDNRKKKTLSLSDFTFYQGPNNGLKITPQKDGTSKLVLPGWSSN
jgi:hypothetical protein